MARLATTKRHSTTLLLMSLVIPLLLVAGGQAEELEVWITDWQNDTRRWWYTEFYPEWQEEYPDIEISVSWPSWGDFTEKLVTATAGGVAPDVFQPGAEFVWEMAEGGFARPLDDFWAQWDRKSDFIPMTLETVRHKGKLWGVPTLSAPRTLLYRTDILRRNGFSPEKLPTTWEEYEEVAVKTTEGTDELIEVLGTDLDWHFHKYLSFLWQNGGRMLTPADGAAAAFNQPPGVEALEFIVDVHNKVLRGRTIPDQVGFRQGLVAAQFDSQRGIRVISEYQPQDLEFVAVGDPLRREAQETPVFTDWFAIHRQSEKADLAWKFIEFFTRPEHLSAYNQTVYYIPPTLSGIQMSDFILSSPHLLRFVEVMQKYGRALASFPQPSRLAGVLNEHLFAAVDGEISPKIALDNAAFTFNTELRRASGP